VSIKPMQKAHNSLRCGAKTRRGGECQAPAIREKRRCRLHGGLSTGAPKGNQNAFKHGRYTAKAIAQRKQTRALLRTFRELVAEVRELGF
jgi:uncharacterized protein YjcR